MKNAIIAIFIFLSICKTYSQVMSDNCYWQSCVTISLTDTFSSPVENRIYINKDTIFNQRLLIKQGPRGNRILGNKVLYTDTFIVSNDSIFWQNYSLKGFYFNRKSFEVGDTIYFLRTRINFPPTPIRFVPIEIVTREGITLFKYKSSISYNSTQLDNLDLKTILEGEYSIDDGFYYIHPILGIVERENSYHSTVRFVREFYSYNTENCFQLLHELEKSLY